MKATSGKITKVWVLPMPEKASTSMEEDQEEKGLEHRKHQKQPAEVLLILRLGRLFGFLPFAVKEEDSGRTVLEFKWISLQMVKFALVHFYTFLYVLFISRGFSLEIAEGGLGRAIVAAPWLITGLFVLFCQCSTLMNRDCLMRLIQMVMEEELEDIRKKYKDELQKTTKLLWKVHLFYSQTALTGSVISVAAMNVLDPTRSVFPSSVFCSDKDSCQLHIMILSAAALVVLNFFYYFSLMLCDILPIAYSAQIRTMMKASTGNLINCIASQKLFYNSNPRTYFEASKQGSKMETALNTTMREHRQMQTFLHAFNGAFAPLLVISLGANFILSLSLFFGFVFATGHNTGGDSGNPTDFAIYLGNGLLFVIRTSMLLTFFGSVRSEATRLKQTLLLGGGVEPSSLARCGGDSGGGMWIDLQLFLSSLDDVYVQAGPYLNCTHGFLFSFYGFLATYIAILYQSL